MSRQTQDSGASADVTPVPEFPGSVPLDFSHKSLIRRCLAENGVLSSDYAVYNLMGWYLRLPPLISRIGLRLVLAVEGPNGDYMFLAPVGSGDIKQPIERLAALLKTENKPCELRFVPKSIAQEIGAAFPNATIEPQRDDFDYIYDRRELAELSGRKFHQKKNFINRIEEEYQPVVEWYTANRFEEVTCFLESWYSNFANGDENFHIEKTALGRMLPHLNDICGKALIVRIQDSISGFTLASPIKDDCWVVSVEKADRKVKGMYQYLNWVLANRLPSEVTLINRETDLGIEGLRTAKLSYHPIRFEEKFTIRNFS